jgi:glycosyltransferase involved in cell wall biosynthesis
MSHVVYVSTYVPKRCGLATYTSHLREHVRNALQRREADTVVAMVDQSEDLQEYDPSLWFLRKDVREDYRKMAERVNDGPVTVVSLQHEFGIFGGDVGDYVLDFVRGLRKPLITTFHTVFRTPQEPYRSVQEEIAKRSDRIVVMSRLAIDLLINQYQLPKEKIVYIPHGTPVPNPHLREQMRKQLGWSEKKVIMTFGLINRGKGIELIINALPKVIREVPNVLYAIVGQTHPEVKKREGEAYREQLKDMIRKLDLEQHVVMIDRYLSEEELVDHITACDLYITPYPGMEQITSGTLAYAVGLGRPVLSTPYAYAQDLLGEYQELLIPHGDEEAWAQTISRILSDPANLHQWERRIGQIGREMTWPQVGEIHARLFGELSQTDLKFQSGNNTVASVSR